MHTAPLPLPSPFFFWPRDGNDVVNFAGAENRSFALAKPLFPFYVMDVSGVERLLSLLDGAPYGGRS